MHRRTIQKASSNREAERGRVLERMVAQRRVPSCPLGKRCMSQRVSDVNPSNLVVYRTPDDRVIGIFNDFDLSSIQDIPSCQERTGTVPFMALDLLMEQVVEGKVKHLYRHDAESFIWVLTWVCLCYECSVFIGKGTPLDDWLKVDAIGCHQNKSSFLNLVRGVIKPSDSHHKNWDLAQSYLDTIGSWYGMRASRRPMAEDHIVFQTWLEDKIIESQRLSRELLDVRVEPIS
ncbi:hypothetical protein DEU56DRAFT_914275 [Suillus clintonianus]|uniref:uncharacterized protein n=1 Tax=Suillus clintonianus TaxID=1904413 RepID=UPI001B8763B7|nr:uncharacterized protein DEU56DRAFT_914275 [Suillus clintonianus]KAG2132079.1 hypothetical protein DEU56DRAFT_914275 [Suillus clintonianus]